MKRALSIGKTILRSERQSKRSAPFAKAAFASAILASAAAGSAATITPLVYLNFANPTIGAYGSNVTTGSGNLPSNSQGATYTPGTGESLGTGITGVSNFAYSNTAGTVGNDVPSFANGMMSISGTTPVPASGPGLSVSPVTNNHNLAQDFVMEAEVTSSGLGNSGSTGSAEIIDWSNNTSANGGVTSRLQLELVGATLTANATESSGGAAPFNDTVSGPTLTTGVETHVALVYSYNSSTNATTLSIYTINDSTGSPISSNSTVSTSTASLVGSTSLENAIGILNSSVDGANGGNGKNTGNAPFDGSANGIFVGTFTGTFNPTDASVGGDFTLTSVVPEPASISLLAAGALLGLRRRRR
jgi:PEP-CTERM motif